MHLVFLLWNRVFTSIGKVNVYFFCPCNQFHCFLALIQKRLSKMQTERKMKMMKDYYCLSISATWLSGRMTFDRSHHCTRLALNNCDLWNIGRKWFHVNHKLVFAKYMYLSHQDISLRLFSETANHTKALTPFGFFSFSIIIIAALWSLL